MAALTAHDRRGRGRAHLFHEHMGPGDRRDTEILATREKFHFLDPAEIDGLKQLERNRLIEKPSILCLQSAGLMIRHSVHRGPSGRRVDDHDGFVGASVRVFRHAKSGS